jgi:hypothetical protein
MKFCPVVPEICRGQVHGARKERRITRTRTKRRIIIIRNGAKTISLQTLFGRLNYQVLANMKLGHHTQYSAPNYELKLIFESDKLYYSH